jgi:hypothetical protein
VPPLTEDQLQAIATRLTRSLPPETPGWSNVSDSDPGVTLLQLFAFLTESLLFRTTRIPGRSLALIDRLTAALTALRGPAAVAWGGGTRVRYFAGQMLSAETLQAEQDYVRGKRRLQNRLAFGMGIVSGLDVQMEAASTDIAPIVTIAPGLAIAADGEPIAILEPLTCTLPTSSSSGFVTLAYVEHAIDPVPPLGAANSSAEPSRIEEGVAVNFVDAAGGSSLAIARLVRGEWDWQIDPAFRPAGRR